MEMSLIELEKDRKVKSEYSRIYFPEVLMSYLELSFETLDARE